MAQPTQWAPAILRAYDRVTEPFRKDTSRGDPKHRLFLGMIKPHNPLTSLAMLLTFIIPDTVDNLINYFLDLGV